MARTTGEALLALQELDLELDRRQREIEAPEDLSRLRELLKTAKRLDGIVTTLTARKKDADMELEELDGQAQELRRQIEAVRERVRTEALDHRQQAYADEQFSQLSKRLDKTEYQAERAMETAEALGAKHGEALRAREHVRGDVAAVKLRIRESVAGAQAAVEELRSERAQLEAEVGDELLATYEQARDRFDGLAVERLGEGRPSVCSMALDPSSLDLIHRQAPITRCPYCRRILVVEEGSPS